ncbi:MAG: immunoglobulin domain-containing protein [Planctomycetota bacterium]
MTAADVSGYTVTGFTGTVDLSATTAAPVQTDIGIPFGSWWHPMNTNYHDARTQAIYLASEMGGPMTINALALEVTTLPGQTMSNWTIRMRHTALSDYTGGAQWEDTGWTVAYQGNETISSTGWVTFSFATPFVYNGVDNVMVDFSFNNTSSTSQGFCRYALVSPARTVHYYTNSGFGDPLTWSGAANPTPWVTTYVPVVRLSGTVGGPLGVAPTVTGAFVAGEWTGNVTVQQAAAGCVLLADDGGGHLGQSGSFDVNGITVTSPDGGEAWYYDGEPHEIAWVSAGVTGNVDIQYSTNGGGVWSDVATDVPDTGYHTWTIPDEDSANCLVRVQETGGAGAGDDSDAAFTMAPATVTVVAPNGAESWGTESSQLIEWSAAGVADVTIELSRDNGTNWETVAASTPAAAGSYSLTVTEPDSSICLVRVSDAADGSPADESDAVFSIVLAVDHFDFAPVATPQQANVAFPVTITAKSLGGFPVTGFTGTVDLSATNEVNGQADIGSGTGTWYYPLSTFYHDARTQVIYLASEIGGPMTVDSLALDVASIPSQTMNNWTIRMKHTSLGDYTGGAAWEDTGWTVVYQNNEAVSSTGWATFSFSTPFDYNGADNLMIDFSFNNTSYTSDGYCRYTSAAQSRTVYYRTDSGYGNPLTWSGTTSPTPLTSTYVPNIRLSGAMGGPLGVAPVVTGAFTAGEWTGDVAVLGVGVGCRLLADDGAGHTGQSNAFGVNGLGVTSPNGGETWYQGASETIAWDTSAASGNVDILYSIDDGAGWTPIATDIANAGSLPWTVPVEDSGICLVRVQETGGAGASDDSDAVFTISPPVITVTAPNGGETLYQSTGETIAWSSGGVWGNVDVLYSADDGAGWTPVATDIADTGSFLWPVPIEDSGICLVRVRETGGAGAGDDSDAVFTIAVPTRASFPFVEGFESGTLAGYWSVSATGSGRTVVETTNVPNGGTYHLLMDSSAVSTYSLNELVLTIDLSGQLGALLSFFCKDFGDEPEVMPVSFAGSSNSDGVAVSADGVNWFRAVDLASAVTGAYQRFDVDLDTLCSASGISCNGAFKIKFQQYDDNPITTDGFAFDDISVGLPPPPTITAHPSDAIVTEPETVTFTVVASGIVSPTYQWRKDGVDIAGATASSYTTPPTTIADEGSIFTCVVANAGGSVTSNPAVLWVNMAPPTITTQPVDQTTYENETATFTVVAMGSAPLDYQWRRDGVDVPGATAASYVTPVATLADDGAVFTCVVTNPRGSVLSFPAALTVLPAFIEVGAPNGGETWYFGGPDRTIVWTSGGVTGNVDIHYSVSGGPPWNTVDTGVPNTGSYVWTIPDENSSSCIVRVREPGGGGVSDVSDAPFTIAPATVSVVAPNGAEDWDTATTQTISWASVGIADVAIHVSRDGGGGWDEVVASTPAAAGSFAWAVTGPGSTDCLVRVSEASDGSPADESDAPFTITAKPELVIESITHAPATPDPGVSATFTVTVRNVGAVDAGLFEVGFWSDSLTAPAVSDVPEFVQDVTSLTAGASTTLDFVVTASSAGSYTAWAYADRRGGASEIDETFEANNAGPAGGHAWNCGVVSILTFILYADTTASGEYQHTLTAISTYFTNYVETSTTTIDPATLAAELAGVNIFLIPEQESAPAGAMASLGSSWAAVLTSLVNAGGTVIACSDNDEEDVALNNSGLMSIDRIGTANSQSLVESAPHVLTAGVTFPFSNPYVARFSTADGTVVVETQTAGDPVVVARDVGAGHVVMIGTDFYTLGTEFDRIIANAVQW